MPPTTPHAPSPTPSSPLALKAAGNAALVAGDPKAALALYDAALAALEGGGVETDTAHPPLPAILQANRSAAALAASDPSTALAAARAATTLAPAWPKAWVRLVRAAGECGEVWEAAAAARAGEAAARRARAAGGGEGAAAAAAASTLRSLMDGLALAAAARGDWSGFDGRTLTVRPAAEGEEWLGLPAPAVAGEEEGRGVLALPSPCPTTASTTSFRSLHAAVAAAADGDTILLLPGTHNALSSSITVAKRVLISGGGLEKSAPPLRSATLDARANAPALRLRGPCVLHGLAVEGTGFRETVRLEPAGHGVAEGGRGWVGPPGAGPLLVECVVRSAGDECVSVVGPPPPSTARWSTTLTRCTIGPSKRAGLRARGGVSVALSGCVVEKTGGAGLVAQRGARLSLEAHSTVRGCGGEGVVVMGNAAHLSLAQTTIERCGGPCVDVSGGAGAAVSASRLEGGEGGGGLWAWGSATRVDVRGHTRIAAAATYALLTDGGAAVEVAAGCVVEGGVKEEEGAKRALPASPSPSSPPARWVGPPPAAGCFVWTPDSLLA